MIQTFRDSTLVTPQNWLFLTKYKTLREHLLKTQSWHCVARLGPGAFETISGEVVKAVLLVNSDRISSSDGSMFNLDVSTLKTPLEKARGLLEAEGVISKQLDQFENPDSIIMLHPQSKATVLTKFAQVFVGLQPGQTPRLTRLFWEMVGLKGWKYLSSSPDYTDHYRGNSELILDPARFHELGITEAVHRGQRAWGRKGILVSKMQRLPATIYLGHVFDDNTCVITPTEERYLPAIWAYVSSEEFHSNVRKLNQKMSVTPTVMGQVPFDSERWQAVANEKYPDGLPKPYSSDPTQWLFRGTVTDATEPLQVAVARLLGYRWPDQAADGLEPDPDGIVCLPAVEDELPAAERLRSFLARAYGEEWSPALLDRLLTGADHAGKDLGTWLRDKFFAQHCKLFHNRPFVWHIWDGSRDGFSALVNYHRLDKANLGRLIYTYLGDWIEAQAGAARAGLTGADLRLAAAQDLKKKLEAILHGEPPYDIYVRWKPLHEQPIGWEPDLNDGVRLNIRPFMQADVLRWKPNIKWNKDRGRNPDGSERLNDLHFTRAEKEEARMKHGSTP